jgi:hypothetical protein
MYNSHMYYEHRRCTGEVSPMSHWGGSSIPQDN